MLTMMIKEKKLLPLKYLKRRINKASPLIILGVSGGAGHGEIPRKSLPQGREARGAARHRGRPRATPQKRDLPRSMRMIRRLGSR